MVYADRHRRDLWIGLGVSLAIHAAGGVALVGVERPAPGIDTVVITVPEEHVPEEEVPDPLRLGIRESQAQTETWLGFDRPTEHAAMEASVEQSAMALSEAGPREDSTTPEAAEQEPVADAAGMPANTAEIAELAREFLEAWAAAAQTRQAMSAPLDPEVGDRPQPQTDAPTESAEMSPPAPPARPAALPPVRVTSSSPRVEAEPGAQPPGSRPSPASGDDPGLITDKEAAAAALKAAKDAVPGQVVAAEGLEIMTRRPRWSRTTVLTRRPGNPVVWLTFGRDGKVRRAGFFRDADREYRTGFVDVDEPLLNALYQWTARGKALDELPRDRADAGVTVRIRVLLMG